jgi:hypothetical protein
MPSVVTLTPLSVTLPALLPAELALAVPPELMAAPVEVEQAAARRRVDRAAGAVGAAGRPSARRRSRSCLAG